jgi:hypothetical protein
MKQIEIESWALGVLERAEKKQSIEDSRVELKTVWPEPAKTARQLAGHANAARGEPILWLIGVDEKQTKIVGANPQELSIWLSQLKTWFDGLAPELEHVNVPHNGVTVSALCFDTSRFPYVVKNPAFGKTSGEAIQFEVPWREGNSTRSATRSNLVSMLSGLPLLPKVEIRSGEIAFVPKSAQHPSYWKFALAVYMVPLSQGSLTFPFHKCSAVLVGASQTISEAFLVMLHGADGKQSSLGRITKSASGRIWRRPNGFYAVGDYRPPGGNEFRLSGPGHVEIGGTADSDVQGEYPTMRLTVRLKEAVSEKEIVLSHDFVRNDSDSAWVLATK